MKSTTIFFFLVGALLLSACGGGGDHASADSDAAFDSSSGGPDVRADDLVTFVYTLPPGAPDPDNVTVMGWTRDGQIEGDICSSTGSGSARLARSSDTYRCTVDLASTSDVWADGQYNVRVDVGQENADRVPSNSATQYYIYELLGSDVPEGCSGGACAYRVYGMLRIEDVDMRDCRVSNGLASGGNVSLLECI